MKFKIIAFLFLTILLASCTVTLRKEEVPPTVANDKVMVTPATEGAGGLVYALPNTGLRFTITAQKIEKKRGDFYLYSERFLGLKEVILEDAVEWQIKGVNVVPFGVANPDEAFQVISTEASAVPLLQMSEDGVLLSVNSPIVEEKEENIIMTAKLPTEAVVPYTEEMLLANSSAKMAQEAANYIYRLRESRTALLSADLDALPPDGDAYAMSLEEIDNLESQFISLFKGEETITCETKTIELVPSEVKDKDVLFRFSSFGGVVASDDLSGSPFFITMEAGDFNALNNTPADSAGLFYKKPAPIMIKVYDGSTEVLSEKMFMGQFGEIQTLPSHMISDEVKIQLYPTTGAIKAISK